jgi:hypothetical protein
VSPTSNSEPEPDKTMTLLMALRTCKRENTKTAVTAAAALPNELPVTSTNESCRELFTEETKKSSTMVSCDKVLFEDEYVFDAESLKMITLPEFCVLKKNAGILKSSCL